MAKDSALYQLMSVRMNGVMNSITNSDGEYQEIIRKSDVYSDRLDQMELSEEVRRLIDGYVSEQNALSSRYGMPLPLTFLPHEKRSRLRLPKKNKEKRQF